MADPLLMQSGDPMSKGNHLGDHADSGVDHLYASPETWLLPAYEQVYRDAMQDIPFINSAIAVRWIAGGRWLQHQFGMLLTPWCMNVLLIPDDQHMVIHVAKGSEQDWMLPQGAFPFVVSSVGESPFFWQSSLFSDMQVFSDDDAAVATAQEVLRQLFTVPPASLEEDIDVSRRSLLTGIQSRMEAM